MSEQIVGNGPTIDYRSPDWHRIAEHLSIEREENLKYVLNKGTSETDTQYYRGRIAQIDAILDWDPYASR